ncbi:mechanosensitive ion channel [Candidatus Peregrinibacteria bacterium]|nr:mechanosensitive ion channel [Candidatus Peregrinibacteria bacterium]
MNTAYAQGAAEEVVSDTTLQISKFIETILTKIPLWITAFILIILTIFVAKIARRIVENKLAEKGIEEEHKELQILGGRMAYSGILVLGITVALKIAGIDLTTIIAAVAFGIGFALKDLIMNFLAGIFILVSRHFTIGDFINVGGTIGKVVEIQSRVTILKAINGTKVIVPNAEIFKKQVTSFTSNPFRRVELVIRIDYRNDIENALKICMHTLKKTKGVLAQPSPGVLVGDFEDNGLNIKIRAWVDSKGGWLKIKSNLAINLKKNLEKHGIVIPWPIRTVVNDSDRNIEETEFNEPEETNQTPKSTPQAPPQPQAVPVPATQAAPQPQPQPQPQAPAPQSQAPAPAQSQDPNKPLKPLGEV